MSLGAGILILVMQGLLRYIVAGYLIISVHTVVRIMYIMLSEIGIRVEAWGGDPSNYRPSFHVISEAYTY